MQDGTEDLNCPVCYSSLDCHAYESRVQDDSEVSDSVFRLKCGHAFHSNCLVRSFQVDASCPVCRNASLGQRRRLRGDQLEAEFIVRPDGSLELVFDNYDNDASDTESPLQAILGSQLSDAVTFLNCLKSVQRSSHVQTVRYQANRVKEEYRDLERFLKKERHTQIQKVFDTFRRRHWSAFAHQRHKLKQALRNVRHAERETLQQMFPENAQLIQDFDKFSSEYTVDVVVGNQGMFGPLKKSFWTR